MYIPAEFSEPDLARARALVERHSFGMLVVPRAGDVPEVAHVPFLLDPGPGPFGTLRAHVARANPIASLLATAPAVVVVFGGPHAYVTPRWYESPRTNVPTWNFTAVHLHGVARPAATPDEARQALRDLAAKHEAGAEQPWTLEATDAVYVERLLGAIVAFSIPVDRFEAKAKLSQNRSPVDRGRVAEGLRARGEGDDVAVADLMSASERSIGPST